MLRSNHNVNRINVNYLTRRRSNVYTTKNYIIKKKKVIKHFKSKSFLAQIKLFLPNGDSLGYKQIKLANF